MPTSREKRQQRILSEAATVVTRKLVDDGRLIEAGFEMFRDLVIPKDASDVQITEMKLAFMAGAQHLYGSMMVVFDKDAEPTVADLNRMEQIHKELFRWKTQLEQRAEMVGKTAGTA